MDETSEIQMKCRAADASASPLEPGLRKSVASSQADVAL
jgi:hypothetical protein